MHTARIWSVAADAAGHFIATGSDDKIVRLWSASDGKLLQTIRLPAGPGNVGKAYAVAMIPDGSIVAAGGWTQREEGSDLPIYLFDPSTGKVTWRTTGDLPDVTLRLAFSANGRYLAALLGSSNGLRVFDREKNWSEVFRDAEYGANSFGAAFATDGG
jgi:WD40 repeat protein